MNLRKIPGVGPKMERALQLLGFSRVEDLSAADPEQMYRRLMQIQGGHVDRCVLYVFRCAVYFASHTRPESELLKWWNWKD